MLPVNQKTSVADSYKRSSFQFAHPGSVTLRSGPDLAPRYAFAYELTGRFNE